MKFKLTLAAAALAMLAGTSIASAEGELNIYNWGNYTNPEMIKKFEEKYKVKVTVTEYDSNDTALAKIKAGGHGFDIAVPSASYVPVWIKDGLFLESRPDQMENFKNLDPKWVDVPFDNGRHYTVPWQWGTVGIAVNTKTYTGDINTWKVIFDPPKELEGKINVVPEMTDVMNAAILYSGGEPCTVDKTILKKARDTLVAAKPKWLSMDYNDIDRLAKGDLQGALTWNGASFRARLANKDIAYGYGKEGYTIWMDNVGILKDAKNVENAKLFMNFIMDPENAALISAFARYANGVKGSEKFMPADMQGANEIVLPEGSKSYFSLACPPESNELYTKIWTELMK